MFFNSSYYLTKNPDVQQAVTLKEFPSALAHFLAFGAAEGRDPNAFFDVSYYLIKYPDVLKAGVNPLTHFLQFGAAEGRSPSATFVMKAQFDTAAYAAANADLAAAGITTPAMLYAHFAIFGFDEDRPGMRTIDGVAITGGVAGDTVSLNLMLTPSADSFTTAVVLTTGTVDGGAGIDTLNITNNAHLTAVTGAKYTNFEILGVADGLTVDMDHIAGITSVVVNDASAAATIVNNLTAVQAGAVTLTDLEGAITLNVKGAATVGQLDTLKITINDGDTTLSEANTAAPGIITSAGVETLEVVAVDDASIGDISNMGAITKVTLSGAGDHVFATGALAANANTIITAATATGTVSINGSLATSNGLTITGSATGVNTLKGSVNNDIIVGGAAADIISGGAGADVMTGGAGVDTFAFSVVPGAATSGAVLGNFDTITDFVVGTDKLQFVGANDVFSAQQLGVQTAVTALDAVATAGQIATPAQIATAMAIANITNFGVSFATFGGNTYVYYETAGLGVGRPADDVFIQLTGLTTLPTQLTDLTTLPTQLTDLTTLATQLTGLAIPPTFPSDVAA